MRFFAEIDRREAWWKLNELVSTEAILPETDCNWAALGDPAWFGTGFGVRAGKAHAAAVRIELDATETTIRDILFTVRSLLNLNHFHASAMPLPNSILKSCKPGSTTKD